MTDIRYSTYGWRASLLLTSSIALALYATAANAQDSEVAVREDDDLPPADSEMIVVTAQKREESIQDVPLSIAVLTREDLTNGGVTEIDDYIETIPSVTLFKEGNFSPQVSIRGVSGNIGGSFDPIAIEIDGLSMVSTESGTILNTQLYDLDRIEVQRGPQGALSGTAALGGAINYVIAPPDLSGFGAEINGEYGRFDTAAVRGIVNVPLSDTLGVRVSGSIDTRDGAVTNLGPSGGDSGFETYGVRGAVRWEPTSRLTISGFVSYDDQDYNLSDDLYLDAFFSDEDREDAIATLEELGGDFFDPDADFITDVGNDGGTVLYDTDVRTDIEIFMAQGHVELDLDRHLFKLSYGRFDYEVDDLFDNDQSEFAIAQSFDGINIASDVIQLEAFSSYGGPIEWVAGFTYRDEENSSISITESGDGELGGDFEVEFSSDTVTKYESFGFFANAFIQPIDKLRLSIGARVTDDEVTFSSVTENFAPPLLPDFSTKSTTRINPRVAINYDITPDLTTYFQFATGYRLGNAQDTAEALGLVDGPLETETAFNYEIGVKGQFFDNRLSLSAAAFWIDYQDLQVADYAFVEDEGYIYFDENGDEAFSRGVELEARARPLDGLELNLGFSYIDTEINEIPYFGEVLEDIDIPLGRSWSVNAGARYTHNLTDEVEAFGGVDFLARDSAFEGVAALLADKINSYVTVDLSAGFETDRYRIEGYFENVFDETYWLSNLTGATVRGTVVTFLPRTYGVRLTAKFGSLIN